MKVDLRRGRTRRALKERWTINRAPRRPEGLLVYFDEVQVRALSADLCAQAGIRWWILDLASPALVQLMRKSMGAHLANAR